MQAIQSDFKRAVSKAPWGQLPVQTFQASVQRLKALTNTCRVPSCTKTVKETELLCASHLERFCDDMTARNAYLNDPCNDCEKEHDSYDCFNGFNTPIL